MPYIWKSAGIPAQAKELHLWPYQSLQPAGFVGFLGATSVMILIPLLTVLGTVALWWLLPFLLAAVGGMWLALNRSRRSAQVSEVLTLTGDRARLIRRSPGREVQEWDCNRYWAQVEMHQTGGPVPYYVTLRGAGRQVEIGAFLSEPERMTLYDELQRAL